MEIVNREGNTDFIEIKDRRSSCPPIWTELMMDGCIAKGKIIVLEAGCPISYHILVSPAYGIFQLDGESGEWTYRQEQPIKDRDYIELFIGDSQECGYKIGLGFTH